MSLNAFLLQADAVLRGERSTADTATPGRTVRQLVGFVLVFGGLYGAVMGSFGGVLGERFWQVVYSALKVPLLLLVTFGLNVPSFFVLFTLLGLRADFPQAMRALISAQAGLTLLLLSFAPFTLLWYASTSSYDAAVLFNALMFALATFGAQALLRREYRPLLERDSRHRLLLRVWLFLYAFVGIQMGWLLRPFVGAPWKVTGFFRPDAWDNAYVILARTLWRLLSGQGR